MNSIGTSLTSQECVGFNFYYHWQRHYWYLHTFIQVSDSSVDQRQGQCRLNFELDHMVVVYGAFGMIRTTTLMLWETLILTCVCYALRTVFFQMLNPTCTRISILSFRTPSHFVSYKPQYGTTPSLHMYHSPLWFVPYKVTRSNGFVIYRYLLRIPWNISIHIFSWSTYYKLPLQHNFYTEMSILFMHQMYHAIDVQRQIYPYCSYDIVMHKVIGYVMQNEIALSKIAAQFLQITLQKMETL